MKYYLIDLLSVVLAVALGTIIAVMAITALDKVFPTLFM
jgi:type II secretory pathway component PulJ